MVRIALFGQPGVVSDDGLREYALARKTLHVLAYVILNRHRPVARDTIAFDLFPDDEEERARGSLRRNLSYLLSALPDGARFISADNERIAWRADAPARVDVIAFEEFARDGNDEAALAEYAGRLLPTIYDEWTTRERERLQDLCHEVLGRTIARERSERRFDAATAHVHRLLEDDPWREDMLRQLMAIRYESGDRAGALAAFDSFARRLRDEMKATPMPETIDLRDAVLRGARLATSEPPRRQPASGAPDITLPLVGRDAALEQARVAWHAAADGRAGVLFIGGEAGCGKSRLTTELALIAEREGGVIVRGFTSSGGEHRPYEAFVDALRDTPGLLDEYAGATFSSDRAARLKLLESVRNRLRQLAHTRPLVLVLEDLHWAGGATIDLLEFVATRLERVPVLIAATFRSDELSRTHPLRALRRQLQARGAGDISLDRLSDHDAMQAAHGALPQTDETALKGAVRWASGLPLLLVEALRDLTSGRPLRSADITELVGDRFERLSAGAETALIFGAVLGERFELDALAAVTGWRDSEVVDAIGESIEHGLVRASTGAPGLTFSFNHDLIRSAAVERIAQADRGRAHGLVARVLVARDDRDARSAEIARHFTAAGEPWRAAEYWLRAARYALDLYANAEAVEAAGAGLALCNADDPTQQRLRYELVAAREVGLSRTGPPEARRADSRLLATLAYDEESALAAAVRVFEAFRDYPEERAETLVKLAYLTNSSSRAAATFALLRARNAFYDGDYATAAELHERSACLFEARGEANEAARMRLRGVQALSFGGRWDEAAAILARLEPEIGSIDDRDLRFDFHWRWGQALLNNEPQASLPHLRAALDIALRIGDRHREAVARHDISIALSQTREYEQSYREAGLALEGYRDLGSALGAANLQLCLSQTAFFAGDFAQAAHLLDEIHPVAQENPSFLAEARLYRAIIAVRCGRFSDAEQTLREFVRRADEAAYGALAGVAHRELGYIYACGGRSLEAASELAQACEAEERVGSREQGALSEALAARVAAELGDEPEARAHAQRALALLPSVEARYYSEVEWNSAAALALVGDEPAARALAERAVASAIGEALCMPAAMAETFLSLPRHRHALDYLCGRSASLRLVDEGNGFKYRRS